MDASVPFLIFIFYVIIAVGSMFLFIYCETTCVEKSKRVDIGWLVLAGIIWPLTYFCILNLFIGKAIEKALISFRDAVDQEEDKDNGNPI